MLEMVELNNAEKVAEYEAFVDGHPQGTFMQSLAWARLKAVNGWKSAALVSRNWDGEIVGSVLILMKKVPFFNKNLLYAPRGPVVDQEDFETFQELIGGIKRLAKRVHAYLFKMDPYVLEEDENFYNMAKGCGFYYRPSQKDLTTIQSRRNYMIDLTGKTADEVFANFHQKWRYNTRVAIRHGVECRSCGLEGLDDFYSLYAVTGERDEFVLRDKAYFRSLLEHFGEHARLYLCYYEGEAIAGAIAVQYGGKTCYVYGASGNRYRNVNPNYIMQWTMIQWALESGCNTYDFQTVTFIEDPTSKYYGIYHFKSGFGGSVVTLAVEFDLIFSKFTYRMVNLGQKLLRSLH